MIGTVVGHYRVISPLSAGGMGIVYRAEHTLLGKPAAIKVLHPELSSNHDIVNRFFNEAKATTSIRHLGIVEVFDFGYLDSGHAYLVMEFLDGETLASALQRGRFGQAAAISLMRGVCSALTAAHGKGIVHRDLKPDNIFLVPDPDSPIGIRPKLLDFGIAKLTDIGSAVSATRTGAVMGTPTYMSPEQCRGTGDVDHRADLYSLGCVLYELVCGRPPFLSQGAGELIGSHLYVNPDSPLRYAPDLAPDLVGLIMSLLAKNPADRPSSAAELSQRLDEVARSGGALTGFPYDPARGHGPAEPTGPAMMPQFTPRPSSPGAAASPSSPGVSPSSPGAAALWSSPDASPAPSPSSPGASPSSPGVVALPASGVSASQSSSGYPIRAEAHPGYPMNSAPDALTMATPYSVPVIGPGPMRSGPGAPSGPFPAYTNTRPPGIAPTTLSGTSSLVADGRLRSRRRRIIAGAITLFVGAGIALMIATGGDGAGTAELVPAASPSEQAPAAIPPAAAAQAAATPELIPSAVKSGDVASGPKVDAGPDPSAAVDAGAAVDASSAVDAGAPTLLPSRVPPATTTPRAKPKSKPRGKDARIPTLIEDDI